MTMTKNTKEAIERIMNKVDINKEYEYKELYAIIKNQGLSYDTFRKYITIETVMNSNAIEYSLEELIKFINDCAGEDCYYGNWDFQIINGKIYDVVKETRYIVKGLKKS